jgi:uncharacterized protein
MHVGFLMLLVVGQTAVRSVLGFSRGSAGASSSSSVVSRRRPTQLPVSFLEEIQKSLSGAFSTMTSPIESGSSSKFFTVGITGSSGLVGTALRDELRRRSSVNGKAVRIINLARGSEPTTIPKDWSEEGSSETTVVWNPQASDPEQTIDLNALAAMDAVIHLAGENVATGLGPLGFLGIRPWTEEKKSEIIKSRVVPTTALSNAMAALPKPQTLLVASGVGAYGDTFVDESCAPSDETADIATTPGFLARVSREWEAATIPAKKSGQNRVVNLRFGVVLSTKGGALAKLYPIFFLGGGGIVGSGSQYFSFISARDIARGIVHCLETTSLEGPVNLSSPAPCTNLEFTKALGKVLNRPTLLPLPSFAVSLAFGEMGEEMLLGGVRCVPSKLLRSGFEFLHPTIEQALQSAVEEST